MTHSIRLALKDIAERLGKSVADIARDTGLHRNAVSALLHGKVDGVKFATLEAICAAYSIDPSELLHLDAPREAHAELYLQEGELMPFTCIPWLRMSARSDDMPTEYFPPSFSRGMFFAKGEYGYVYWERAAFERIAKTSYERLSHANIFDQLWRSYEEWVAHIEAAYAALDSGRMISMDASALVVEFQRLVRAFDGFWTSSIFIDAFDIGVDRAIIDRLARTHGLTDAEVATLTTPAELTFNNAWTLALLQFVDAHRTKLQRAIREGSLVETLTAHAPFVALLKRYDYVRSNYAHVRPWSVAEVAEEITRRLQDPGALRAERIRLEKYEATQERAVNAILRAHRFATNPLWFFERLTMWREHRKMVNLKGIHVLNAILDSTEQRSGIAKKHLGYCTFEEIPLVLQGIVTRETLQRRYDEGMLIIADRGSFRVVVGAEAASIKEELDAKTRLPGADLEVFSGQTASQGRAIGRARIILTKEDFPRFAEGDVLVTSMTRPEYLPIMRKAAAIVTNEGGVTCHAAIVSRELGIPCIIGTKHATTTIHEGDLVEVRANHGTVRILERARSTPAAPRGASRRAPRRGVRPVRRTRSGEPS